MLTFKVIITQAMREMFGLAGVSITVDILKYNEVRREAILRVPQSGLVKLWSSLTLLGTFQDKSCAFRVIQISSHLIALAGNSRSFIFDTS